jgi:hypothetical protein
VARDIPSEAQLLQRVTALTASVVQERDGNDALDWLLSEQLDQLIAIAVMERLTGEFMTKLKRAAIAA